MTNITRFITEGLEYTQGECNLSKISGCYNALPKALLALQIAVEALDSLEGVEPYVTRVLVEALAEIERVLK